MRTRAVVFNFSNSSLLLGIEYCYDSNQLIKVKTLTGNQTQLPGSLPMTILARTIKMGEIVLVRTQTYIVIILNYYKKE